MSRLVGIFGGTFDPVHNGHTQTIINLSGILPFDEIKVVPNGIPPHRASVGSINNRLEMVKMAFQGIEKVTIDSREINRLGPSYAITTAKELVDEYKEDKITWIMGSDAFAGIDTWHHWEEFIELINIVIMMRPDSDILPDSEAEKLILKRAIEDHRLLKEESGQIMIVKMSPIHISSTLVRTNILSGDDVKNLISLGVEEYIDEKKLYKKTNEVITN